VILRYNFIKDTRKINFNKNIVEGSDTMNINDQKEVTQNNNGVEGKRRPNILLGAFMMFIFPLIAIFLGVFIGTFIGEAVDGSIFTFQIIGGIVGVILAGIGIKLFDRSSKMHGKTEKIYWDDL
jgi:positive regulator of sigma E activity